MISAVSFGSTYQLHFNKKNSVENQFGYHNLTKYCKNNKIPYNAIAQYNIKYLCGNTEYNADTVIVAPDKKDLPLETFMKQQGINYKKLETDNLLRPEEINKRIAKAPEGYYKVFVDSVKLGRILETQWDNNFRETKIDYKKHNKQEVSFMLKSGREIPASTLEIKTRYNPEEELPRIEKGLLEPNAVVCNFEQKTNSPDHCMYMAMQELGMQDIPVYMTNDTYNAAFALGILRE